MRQSCEVKISVLLPVVFSPESLIDFRLVRQNVVPKVSAAFVQAFMAIFDFMTPIRHDFQEVVPKLSRIMKLTFFPVHRISEI